GGVAGAGLLARPTDADERLPLVVVIPAGPASLPVCRRELATWCRAGFAAFAAGYRSSGTGGREPMLAALRGTDGTPGRSDALDVLAGLDEVLASGIADPDRLFLFGHALGGYLVNRIATMDDRFRAGVAWDGYADAALCYCLDGGGGGNQVTRRLYDGSPWDRSKRYREMSPIEDVGRVRTPLLLLHSDAAPAEPVVWFTALREHG